jgi:hypothetical protein
MVNIFLTILPIGKLSLIVTHFHSRRIIFGDCLELTFRWQNLEGSKSIFVSGTKLHRVRIDNLGLLLKVKSIFLSQNTCLPNFVGELLLIVRDCTARIRVANKAI